MIEITIGELMDSVPILQKLASTSLKAKTAWQVSRVLREAEKEIQSVNEARYAIVQKYGIRNEDDTLVIDEYGNYKIQDEFLEQCTKESAELYDTVIEINVSPISIDDLENVNFTPAEVTRIEKFIE